MENLLNEVKTSDLSVKNLRQTQIDLIEQCRRLQAEKTKVFLLYKSNSIKHFTKPFKVIRSNYSCQCIEIIHK